MEEQDYEIVNDGSQGKQSAEFYKSLAEKLEDEERECEYIKHTDQVEVRNTFCYF